MLKKILVVDDDSTIWRMIKSDLLSSGYSLRLFNVPLNAHRYMEESADYDAAIFDAKFEGKNPLNYSVFDLINFSKAYNPNAPIVIFTGYNAPTDSGKGGWSSGVLKWITKPIFKEELIKTFDDYFKLKE
jgi:CheY-like chemotaxis protein